MLAKQYAWLETTPGLPLVIKEGLKLCKMNMKEIPGAKSNPNILLLAKIAGVDNIYKNDDIAWCAVAQTAICLLANKSVEFTGYDRLRAKSFLKFGVKVDKPMLGDILVFTRDGGGHVGMYVGEDSTAYHVMGGNQSNDYNIIRIAKNRLSGARRPIYNNQPASIKQYMLASTGVISKNEA